MRQRMIRALITLLCLAALWTACASGFPTSGKHMERGGSDITALALRTEDGVIRIRWNTLDPSVCEGVDLEITDGKNRKTEELSAEETEYLFQDGEHGVLYLIRVQAKKKDASKGTLWEGRRMFLEFDTLPDLPLLSIDTDSGRDPSYEIAEKPDEYLLGRSITQNEFETGILYLSKSEDAADQEWLSMKLRVRGNTSVVNREKLSYKLKLSEDTDLFGNGSEPAKNWVLLNAGTDLDAYTGSWLSTICGMEWQTPVHYVNLMLNGDWKGTYVLAQSVGKESGKPYITKDGMIFENDAYWWNDEGASFRLRNQVDHFAYTFKYPDIYSEEDETLLYIRDVMQQFEDRLYGGDPSYADLIDVDSFANWILVRDILGQGDAGGTNMFFYKADQSDASKVKMGPLWDFDSAFERKKSWSACRSEMVSYFPQLFATERFDAAYRDRWSALSQTLASDIAQQYEQMRTQSLGAALQESWDLDAARWNRDVKPLDAQIEDANAWFTHRVQWMNKKLEIMW